MIDPALITLRDELAIHLESLRLSIESGDTNAAAAALGNAGLVCRLCAKRFVDASTELERAQSLPPVWISSAPIHPTPSETQPGLF